jgi:hypothetical protein
MPSWLRVHIDERPEESYCGRICMTIYIAYVASTDGVNVMLITWRDLQTGVLDTAAWRIL